MNLHEKRDEAMIIGGVPGYGEELAWILIDAGSDVTVSERGSVPGIEETSRSARYAPYSLLAYILPESLSKGEEDSEFLVGALLDAALTILSQVSLLRAHSDSRVVLVGPPLEAGGPSKSSSERWAMKLLGRLYRALYLRLAGEGIHLEIIGGGLSMTADIWEHIVRNNRRPDTVRCIHRYRNSTHQGFVEYRAA